MARQGLFVFGCKKPFALQPGFQLLKGHLHGAQAVREQIFHINLKCAVPLEQGYTAAHDHAHAVLRHKAQLLCIGTKHHGLYGTLLIFQSKIKMACFIMIRKIGNLTAQRNVRQNGVALQNAFYIPVQRRHADHIGHAPTSFAAIMATPMALSLANCPGTKQTSRSRAVT